MQAEVQSQSTVHQPTSRRQITAWIAALWVGIHLIWFAGPWIAPDYDFPIFTRFVVAGTLIAGLAGLAGLWQNQRWGWWTTVIVCVVNAFLTAPEIFGLPGMLRVISIAAMVVIITSLVLLFRPGVRPARDAA